MKSVYCSIYYGVIAYWVSATQLAFADAPAGGAGAHAPMQPWQTFMPFIAIFAIMYFMVFRPQQKKAKLHQSFLTELKRGDMVVASSGIIGTIKNLSDKFVTLEVDDGVCIKVVRSHILEGANSLKDDKEEKR